MRIAIRPTPVIKILLNKPVLGRVANRFRFLILALMFIGKSWADPVDLEAPSNSLGAADLYGNVRIWREVEQIDFGKGLELPLRLGFSSADQRSSKYAGKGWTIPLLESVAFLKREKMMEVVLLCGKTLYLRRDTKDLSKFQTLDREWTGVQKGDQITISRPDGWELQYRQGKLWRMKTDAGRVLTWIYNGNLVREIREEGVSMPSPLQVVISNGERIPTGMMVNGKLHVLNVGKRPLVKNDTGIQVVAQLDPSLERWTWPDGKKETYEFKVTSEIMPSLKMTDREGVASEYTWNPTSGHILTAEEWTYRIGATDNPLDLPKIERSNARSEQEYTVTDLKTGITERKTLDEGHRITQMLVSPGPFYGKVRKVEEVDTKGKRKTTLQLNYDEEGRLFREIDSTGFATVFDYGKDGKLKGKKILPPIDPIILAQLDAKKKDLIAAIENAKEIISRNDALQSLGFFYIHNQRNIPKALELLPLMSNAKQKFNIRFQAIEEAASTTDTQKIDQLQKLLKEFPDEKEILTALIDGRKQELARNQRAYQ